MMDDTSAQREWLAEVGMRVRLARVRRRETQEPLATRAAVSRVTLGSIERDDHEAGGISKPVGPHTLRQVFITAALDAAVPRRDV